MKPRRRGGDDRRTWVIAAASSFAIVAIAVVAALLLAAPPHGGAPSATTATPAGQDAGSSPPPSAAGSAAASASVPAVPTPAPPPINGPDDAGPPLVPLDDPNGPADVARQLFGSGGSSCGSAHDTYASGCALTGRFAARLSQLYRAGPPYEPLCRCQAAWNSVSIQRGDAGPHAGDGNQAAASVVFSIGGKHETLTLLVERTSAGWLANDSWCGADSSQDMYVAVPPGCAAR